VGWRRNRHVTVVGKNLPWNKGLLVGQKKPLQPKHVWSIRIRLEISGKGRDLALFNFRACEALPMPASAERVGSASVCRS
jgi:hypothetical protein